MIIGGILVAVLVFLFNLALVRPVYLSDAKVTINANNQNASLDFNKAFETAKDRISTRSFLKTLNTGLGTNFSRKEINEKLSLQRGDDSQIIMIEVEDTILERANDIANETANILITENTDTSYNITVIDDAQAFGRPIRPDYVKTSMVGFLVGFLIAMSVSVLSEKGNYILQEARDLKKIGLVPIGDIPYMEDGEVVVHE